MEREAQRKDWQHEVSNGDTQLGFEEWLQHQQDAARVDAAATSEPEPQPRKLTDTDKVNFNTLCDAVQNGDVMITDCFDTLTGRSEVLICATEPTGEQDEHGENVISLVPLALLLNVHEAAYDRIRPIAQDEKGYAPVSGCEQAPASLVPEDKPN